MDSKRIKLITKFLERVFQSSHSVSSAEMVSEQALRVNWSQNNFRDNATYNYSNFYSFNNQSKEVGQKLNDFPIQVSTTVSVSSPKLQYRATLQQIPDKTKTKTNGVIEIYKGEDVIQQASLAEFHEKVLNDAIVGPAFVWNKSETKFLYLAQIKIKPTKTYFEVDSEADLADAIRNNKYEQDYGEKSGGTTKTQLFEYDVESATLYSIDIPENVYLCYPQYLDEKGEQILFQGYKVHPEFKYGILHCFNRYTDVYLLEKPQRNQLFPKLPKDTSKEENKQEAEKKENEKKEVEFKILSNDEASFRPIISPDGKKIAYFGAPVSPAHVNYLAMKIISTEDWSIKEIIPIRKENLTDSGEFMGICGYYDDLKNFTWLNDSKHFLITSNYSGSLGIYLVNTETKEVGRFDVNKTLSDVFQILNYNPIYNTLFASHVNMKGPSSFAFLKNLDLSQDVQTITKNAQWQYITLTNGASSIFPSLKKLALDNFEETLLKSGESRGFLWRISQFNNQEAPKELKELYENNEKLNPLSKKDEERPLIVFIHGGPHGSIRGDFTTLRMYFLLQGYNILAPNFTGSAGFGQEYINKLLTKIGDTDTKEILDMIDQVIEKKLCDPTKIIVMGGSYGGYMTGILAARHPSKFLCGILLNPVVNIPFNINITDIPDWCVAESFGKKMTWNLTGDDYKTMFEQSPMSLPNKLTTLNLVGAKDRRVPYQQSLAYHAQSVFNGTDIQTYVYPESDHALDDSLPTIFDELMKQITFIETNLLK
ncbi:hypothetical protein ABPG74_007876 [Tetrahymena malaccensis]